MASTSQKKTTKKTSGKSGSRTTAKKPQPRPIRREVGGVVCLVLALCVFVSYFGISAIFIDWLAVLIKGLLGYGYWLFGPALVLAGCILLFHHGRPVTLRVTSALLLPVLLGTLCHMLLVKEAYASSIGIIPAMWKDLCNIDHLYFVKDGLKIADQKIHPHGHGWSIVNNVDQWTWE